MLVAVEEDFRIVSWSLSDKDSIKFRPRKIFKGHHHTSITCIGPDNAYHSKPLKLFASGSRCSFIIWDYETCAMVQKISSEIEHISSIGMTPNFIFLGGNQRGEICEKKPGFWVKKDQLDHVVLACAENLIVCRSPGEEHLLIYTADEEGTFNIGAAIPNINPFRTLVCENCLLVDVQDDSNPVASTLKLYDLTGIRGNIPLMPEEPPLIWRIVLPALVDLRDIQQTGLLFRVRLEKKLRLIPIENVINLDQNKELFFRCFSGSRHHSDQPYCYFGRLPFNSSFQIFHALDVGDNNFLLLANLMDFRC